MEGPLAPVQVSQEEAWGVGLPEPGTEASENLSLVSLCLQLLQVVIEVLVLLGLWLVPLPLLVLQLLLQPLLPPQLLLRQPLQVPVLLLIPVPIPYAFPTPTCQNQGGAGAPSRESRREVSEETSPASSTAAGPQNHCSCPRAHQARGPSGSPEKGAAGPEPPAEADRERQWQQLQWLQFPIQVPECQQRVLSVQRHIQQQLST